MYNLKRILSFEEKLINENVLSKGQLREIKHMFELVDEDKDGKLSITEVGKLVMKLTKSKISHLLYSNLYFSQN